MRRFESGRAALSLHEALERRLGNRWRSRRAAVLRTVVVLLAVEACVYLAYEFWRLLLERGEMGAIDLHLRVLETHDWFGAIPVYGMRISAVYPPASYAILWPFVGWMGFEAARWLWAAVTIIGLAWLAILLVRASGASESLERGLVVLCLLAIYPTGQTIGNGQLLTLALPLLLAGVFLSLRERTLWRIDLLIVLFFLVALVKPTGVIPLLLVPLLTARRLRVLVTTAGAYAAVTVMAASFQKASLPTLLHQWSKASTDLAAYRGSEFYANVHAWLAALGLKSLLLPASLCLLVALTWWIWRHREVDPWLLMGVAAIVARFWSYHHSYDDMLMVLPMIALFRIAKHDRDIAAGGVFAVTLALMAVPGGLFIFPPMLRTPFTTLETVVWLGGLGFLVSKARKARCAQLPRGTAPTLHQASV